MSSKDKTWTAGTLKSRGWTEELLASLLPRAQYRYFSGRRVRVWRIEDIKRAEQTPAFHAGKSAPAPQPVAGADIAVEEALRTAGAILAGAWDTASLPEGDGRALAERFHRAILSEVPRVSWASRLKVGQSRSYIDSFLHLAEGDGKHPLTGVLRRFVTAAPWIGRNPENALVKKLSEDYPAVLLAIAEREIRLFAAAQPEANLEGLLARAAFPTGSFCSTPCPISTLSSISPGPSAPA